MDKEKIVVFCAHPDDEILGVGGTIAKYAKHGKEVITIIFSYGEGSHFWLKKHVTVRMRVEEAKNAGDIVGSKEVLFIGLKDTKLSKETKKRRIIEAIKDLIEKHDPSKIFTHSKDDVIYSDHKAVHKAVFKAIDESRYKGEVYTFNIWAMDVRRRKFPKLVVDISETFELKKKALGCFKSQQAAMAQLMPKVYSKAILHGLENNVKYAEVFYKNR